MSNEIINERVLALETHARFSDQTVTVTEIVQTENSSIAVWGGSFVSLVS